MTTTSEDEQQVYFFPMSFAQQRLWLFQQIQPESTAYNITGALRLSGDLNINALEQAIKRIVQRHEILRTTFRSYQGEPSQWLNENVNLVLEKTELEPDSLVQQLQKSRKIAAQLAVHIFDLETGPLIKLQLLTLSENEYVFISVVHHIISDGWSSGVFVKELMMLYQANLSGQMTETLAELELQYGDYALWQRDWFKGEIRDQQINYWQTQLAGMPPLITLPTDMPRPSIQSFKGSTIQLQLPAKITAALKKLADRESATLNMVLLAAFFVLLHRYNKVEDLVIGTPVANRNQHELEPLIGFFVNTLVLRNHIDPGLSFSAILKQIKATSLTALQYQDCPFEQLMDHMKHDRSLSYSPLIQVLFSYQNTPDQVFKLPDVKVSQLQLQRENAQFDLALMASENEDEISLEFAYCTDLFLAETIDAMAQNFINLCQAVSTNAKLTISTIPLITDAYYQNILNAWENKETFALKKRYVQSLNDQQIKFKPESLDMIIDKAKLYIVDEVLNPLPFGVPGELCLGALNTSCFLNIEDYVERFQPDPFIKEPGVLIFRTGTLVKFTRKQGFEEFITSTLHQEKRFRIDLLEMEKVLSSFSEITDAVIIASVDNNQDDVLTAYVVGQNNSLEITELREFLAKQLPQFILPQKWHILNEMPLTSDGMIDRETLPGNVDENITQQCQLQMPKNEIEQILLQIWQEVLLNKEIGTEQSFFDLGGHSLNATQIVSRIKQAIDVEVPIRVIFEKPSIRQQAEWILSVQFEALDSAEQDELLAELDQLSDDELNSLL